MSETKNKRIGITVFLGVLCLSFMLSVIDTSAFETTTDEESILEKVSDLVNTEGVLQLEINNPSAIYYLKAFVLVNDIEFQLLTQINESFRFDFSLASINIGTLCIIKK